MASAFNTIHFFPCPHAPDSLIPSINDHSDRIEDHIDDHNPPVAAEQRRDRRDPTTVNWDHPVTVGASNFCNTRRHDDTGNPSQYFRYRTFASPSIFPRTTTTCQSPALIKDDSFATPAFGEDTLSFAFKPELPLSATSIIYPSLPYFDLQAASRSRKDAPPSKITSKKTRDRDNARYCESRYKERLHQAITNLRTEMGPPIQIFGTDHHETFPSKHATINKAAELMKKMFDKILQQELIIHDFLKNKDQNNESAIN